MAIELEDTLHADGSLEMEADKLRVSAALQAKIAAPVAVAEEGVAVGARAAINFIGAGVAAVDNPGANRVDVTLSAPPAGAASEFWAPPAVAHPSDVEGVAASLGPYKFVATPSWADIVSSGAVSGLSYPTLATARLSYNKPASWISVQPAANYPVALLRTFEAGTRPTDCQFSFRVRHPVPENAAFMDTMMFIFLSQDSAGKPDASNYVGFQLMVSAANTTIIRTVRVAGGSVAQQWDSLNFDLTPMTTQELVIACQGSTIRLFIRSAWLHAFSSTVLAGLAPTAKQHLSIQFSTGNTGTAAMPFAPVYQVDYMRQLDSADVF